VSHVFDVKRWNEIESPKKFPVKILAEWVRRIGKKVEGDLKNSEIENIDKH
jgi:hypothetical protein